MTELHRGAQRLNMLHIMIEHPLERLVDSRPQESGVFIQERMHRLHSS